MNTGGHGSSGVLMLRYRDVQSLRLPDGSLQRSPQVSPFANTNAVFDVYYFSIFHPEIAATFN